MHQDVVRVVGARWNSKKRADEYRDDVVEPRPLALPNPHMRAVVQAQNETFGIADQGRRKVERAPRMHQGVGEEVSPVAPHEADRRRHRGQHDAHKDAADREVVCAQEQAPRDTRRASAECHE
eukprot:1927256-Prymnesium_polylepis.5